MTLQEFLCASYTAYHAVQNGVGMLRKAGFVDIDGGKPSGKPTGYYRVCGGSLLAARMGSDTIGLVLSHTDSPSLRIRYRRTEETQATLDVEKYGGGILRAFLDRKLKIAGRVIVREGDTLRTQNVCSDFYVTVPSLAVHLGGGSEELTLSRDMRPVFGHCDDLYAALGVPNAVDGDLFCVPAEEPFVAGAGGEYLCAPRLDNLVSVYASLRALTECVHRATCAIACFHNEETGSETREGAQSDLLRAFLGDCFAAAGRKIDLSSALSRAFAFSCDGAHALHPNRKDKYAEGAPTAGGGVAIKRNDRYATDALSAAAAAEIFARAGKTTQTYFHHADLRCGSTIGLTVSHRLGVTTCDIGVGQWAMHSAVETAALSDIDDLCVALTCFFGCEVTVSAQGISVK